MAIVPTTAGPIEAAKLGRTLAHEHLLTGPEGARAQWPHLFDRDGEVRSAIAEVRRAQAHGVETICDPTCLDLGRDVALHRAVTAATGVRFVLATGAYDAGTTFAFPGLRAQLRDCLIHDLTVGIQGTDVKAAFIKVAADVAGLTATLEEVHRVAAQVSRATGAPIMAHSAPRAHTGLAQMALFLEEGVDPVKVQIAHTGDTDDLDYIEELLATGCYIGMDRYGLDRFLAHDRRQATVAALVERGYADRMTLSQDSVVNQAGTTRDAVLDSAPNWHMTFLFDVVIPELIDMGVPRASLEAMIGANVHAWLSA